MHQRLAGDEDELEDEFGFGFVKCKSIQMCSVYNIQHRILMFEVYKCARFDFTLAYGTFMQLGNLFLAFQFAITRPSDPITNELTPY